ncbi:MAG: hypothetical protein KDB35_21885 [Acidimicrobiales bacterium]|nr:hypothetical protein [Acidimicrobiales bacterium]MCB1017904.1 hypothetical protein [Acidimicrobiales bacterium]MCB9371535.1 hypothetical protein [Microthrixaceae bacterium]
MTTFPPPTGTLATAPVEPPGRVSRLWWVLVVVLFLGAAGLGIGGCAQLIVENTPSDASTFDVPGRGAITVEETGTYRIRYQSDRFVETGVCRVDRRRTGTGSNRRTTTETICDPSRLALEGEPVVRPPGGGDRLSLDNGDAGVLRINDEITVTVWTFEADEAGTYTVRSDAPLGTQRLVVEPDKVELGGLLLVLLAVPVFVVAVVLLIVTAVRAGSRRRRRNQAAFAGATAGPGPASPGDPGYPPAPPPP